MRISIKSKIKLINIPLNILTAFSCLYLIGIINSRVRGFSDQEYLWLILGCFVFVAALGLVSQYMKKWNMLFFSMLVTNAALSYLFYLEKTKTYSFGSVSGVVISTALFLSAASVFVALKRNVHKKGFKSLVWMDHLVPVSFYACIAVSEAAPQALKYFFYVMWASYVMKIYFWSVVIGPKAEAKSPRHLAAKLTLLADELQQFGYDSGGLVFMDTREVISHAWKNGFELKKATREAERLLHSHQAKIAISNAA